MSEITARLSTALADRYKIKNPDAPAKEIHVVVNWFEVLRELEESGGN